MQRKLVPIKIIYSIFVVAFVYGCNDAGEKTIPAKDSTPVSIKDASIPGSFSTQTTLKFDSSALPAFLDSFAAFKVFEKDITSFYQSRKYAYAWFDENGLVEPANNLYNRIMNIDEEGLPDKIPYKEKFTQLLETADKPSAALDLMLTSEYLSYAKYAWQGIGDKEVKELEWLLPRKKISYTQLLDSLSANKITLNQPVYRQYALLKTALKTMKELKNSNRLPLIKTDKKKLQEGDSLAVIADIRTWLFVMGDLADDNKSSLFDSSLTVAVKSVQKRHGLKDDGIIGAGVIAEMNYPLEKRIQTIMVNMERSRWVPEAVEKDYLLINIPAYKLYAFENDHIAFDMNVVVGKSQHKTVIFNGDLKYIVMSPYWNVPYSILKNEVLPGIKRNPNYLARHNMEWNGNSVRQKPGPNNSLGLVKFLFPNSHSIYLHDTPSKSLFNETNRAFSHGCIRLAEPKKLAVYLLRNDPKWNEEAITTAMNAGKEQYVTLTKTIPVFIAYFTAWVDRDGKLNLRKDVYNRDSRLAEMILEKPSI
jgi:L,D-transpeptidase YcbB